MEVHEAGVWLPWLDCPANPGVVQRIRSSEPSSEAFLRADVVAGEHVQTAKASEQHILRRPSSDTAQFEQTGADLVVVFTCQRFEVESASLDRASQRQQRVDFLLTEADCLIPRWPKSRHVAWGWKPIVRITGCSTPHVADSRQSVKQARLQSASDDNATAQLPRTSAPRVHVSRRQYTDPECPR
jgi:hypothetical protein